MATVKLQEPRIIQGGMGIAVSNWKLAKAVAEAGQLGVVSGTALSLVFAERLKRGDPGGYLRTALDGFPYPEIAHEIFSAYFRKPDEDTPTRPVPMYHLPLGSHLVKLTVVANFCEVHLAKQGHSGLVGINYLEKLQLPHLPSLYGAMLAGVDYVLMGAGIPREIPGALDKLSRHQAASLKIAVEGASTEDDYRLTFNPADLGSPAASPLKRPRFIAIVSSETLASSLAKKSNGQVDGFVVEYPCAGGHNAPPRGVMRLNEAGEPIYGVRDEIDLEKIKNLGLPFWLAGGKEGPGHLARALSLGACGVQVGTGFAFCDESGLIPELKETILMKVLEGSAEVHTDPFASPTGFPFKVVRAEKTLSEREIYEKRPRVCQLGFLRKPYKQKDGTLGYRCPGEPEENYVAKGGRLEETTGRKCLCNALMANIGLPQQQASGYIEPPLVTAGDGLGRLEPILKPGRPRYSARDFIEYLLSPSLTAM